MTRYLILGAALAALFSSPAAADVKDAKATVRTLIAVGNNNDKDLAAVIYDLVVRDACGRQATAAENAQAALIDARGQTQRAVGMAFVISQWLDEHHVDKTGLCTP